MAIAILKKSTIPNDDLVVISRREYEALKDKAENTGSVPVVHLRGNAAKKLDRRVAAALREYKSGKLKPVRSLRELL